MLDLLEIFIPELIDFIDSYVGMMFQIPLIGLIVGLIFGFLIIKGILRIVFG